MFGSYATSALRSLQRDKFHAALNIVGLAVSLAAALLIALYIRHELSYDNFFTAPERVYRIESHYQNSGQPPIDLVASPGPTKDALEADFPNQMTVTSIYTDEQAVSTGDKLFNASVFFVDENLFDVLDFPVLKGDAAAALAKPGTVLLSQKMARRIFGTDDAIGRSVRIGKSDEFRVAAILKNVPDNSHLSGAMGIVLSVKAPISIANQPWNKRWTNANSYTYVRLAPKARAADIAPRLNAVVDRRMPDDQKSFIDLTLSMRALEDIHLQAGDDGFPSDSNAIAVYALGGTAAFLILIACFNYINLATARALLRTKEVGMRKILGGSTRQLIFQFMSETLATTVFAFVLAIGLTAVALPVFANLMNRQLGLGALMSPGFLGFAVGLLIFVSMAAGIYPALVLASSKPVDLFQNQKSSTGGRNVFRSVMVGVQFSLTVGLIIAASVVFTQVNYLKNIDLGFRKQGLLVISGVPAREEAKRGKTFRDTLSRSPYFTVVAGSNSRPQENYENNDILSRAGSSGYQDLAVQAVQVDPTFFDVFGIAPVAGRVFSDDFSDARVDATDDDPVSRGSIVITESAVPYFGFTSPEDAVGKHLERHIKGYQGDFTIVGVVPDIHYRLARAPKKPMVYTDVPANFYVAIARVAPGGNKAALAYARQTWKTLFPDRPFDYAFLDDLIAKIGAGDNRQSELFTFFTGLAIVVACLGLFGLASFVAARRTQEIAIRKVMGASTTRITGMLLWDFAKPVLLANVVAWPIAWLLMRQWLDGFPYRVDLTPAYFIGASALALAIALLTVMIRTFRTARIRPAAALKYE